MARATVVPTDDRGSGRAGDHLGVIVRVLGQDDGVDRSDGREGLDSGCTLETEPMVYWQTAGGVGEGRVQRDLWAERADARAAVY